MTDHRMAQQYYGPSENHISLFTAPASSATYPSPTSYPTNSLAPSGTTNVKLEPPVSSHPCGNSNVVNVGRPNKRQKIADEDSKHKFVSQKKWKFSDGQTWISSKVSSKAQNASKIGIKSKQESITPERLLSPVNAASVPHSVSTTDSVQLPCKDGLAQHESPTISKCEGSSKQTSSALASRKPRQRYVASMDQQTQLQTSLPKSPSGQVSDAELERRAGDKDGRISDLPTTPPAPVESETLMNQTRALKIVRALSLEKDAERIAALIAQKRKENESSMFRERMLQRQQEHKTHKDLNKEKEAGSEALLNNALISSPSEAGTGHHDVHGKPPSSTISLSSSPGSHRSSGSPIIAEQVQEQAFRAPVVHSSISPPTQRQAALNRPKSTTNMVPNYTAASKPAGSSKYLENEGPRGIRTIPKAATNSVLTDYMTAVTTNPTVEIADGNISSGLEGADFAAQPASFSSQFISTEQSRSVVPGFGRPTQSTQPQHYGRQRSTPSQLPTLISQRTHSTGPIESERTRTSPMSFVSPTSSTYLQSPTNVATHHFSHLGLTPSYSHQTATTNISPARQYGHLWTKQALSSPMNHPTAARHTWQTGNLHNDHLGMVHSSVSQNLPSEQDIANTRPATSTQAQRVDLRTSVLRPDPNRLGGNARLDTVGDRGQAPPKARVNMFSNPKGAPFPMEEVIRQIEMT